MPVRIPCVVHKLLSLVQDVANTERCRAIKANGFDAIVSRQVHTRQFVSTNPDHHDKEDSPLELEKYLRMCSSIASKPDRHRVYLHGCSSIATKSDKYLRMCSSIAENPDRYLGYLEGCSSIASEPIQKRNAASIRRDFKEKFIVGRLMRYRTSISTDMHKIWGVIRRATKSPGYNVFIGMLLCHFLFLCMLRDLVVRSWAKMKSATPAQPTPRTSTNDKIGYLYFPHLEGHPRRGLPLQAITFLKELARSIAHACISQGKGRTK